MISKNLYIIVLVLFIKLNLYAQTESAVVDFSSQSKGVLIPRMTTMQRLLISKPVDGLIVYDTTLHSFFYYDGSNWRNNPANNTNWTLKGNILSGENGILGTQDESPLVIVTNASERLRIMPDGTFILSAGLLNIGNGNIISRDLTTKRNVFLNSEGGTTFINGVTVVGGPAMNSTIFTGDVHLNKGLSIEGLTNINNSIYVNGSGEINSDLRVNGEAILKNLMVRRNFLINSEGGTTTINGTTIIGGPLKYPTTFTGNVGMKSDFGISGNTILEGTLAVNKKTTLNSDLSVIGATNLKNSLIVDEASKLKKTLEVDGVTTLNEDLFVSKDDSGFVAEFKNTNALDGDGIHIILGKEKSDYILPPIPAEIDTLLGNTAKSLKDLLRCDLNDEQKLAKLQEALIDDAKATVKVLAGLAVGVGNLITKFINKEVGLPYSFGPYNVPELKVPEINLPYIEIVPEVDVGLFDIGPYGFGPFKIFDAFQILPEFEVIPKITIPEIPKIDFTSIGIPNINLDSLNFWSIPSLCLTDKADSSPLNNRNEFIRFSDKNKKKMGAIRAESVSDWSNNYLNPLFLYKLRGALTSSKVDKFHAQWHFKSLISDAVLSYRKIGIEYTSGAGDYAEWLERFSPEEYISQGDIIAIKAGKITKDLTDAEQVMAVSHNPIVLGNIPSDEKLEYGNNIAFMGQIPVKIMGPVKSGDYIVGNNATPGYGLAKSPQSMSINDFKYVVGRAWEDNANTGPMFVNTVVGVHNGDYIRVLKNYEDKFRESELRFKALESKVDVLIDKLKLNSEN